LVSCYDALTGRTLSDRERRPEGFAFTASPWAANGRIFCLNENGACYVLRAGDKFELLHINKLADDDMCMATPALAGDRLLIRTAARLYCLQSTPAKTGAASTASPSNARADAGWPQFRGPNGQGISPASRIPTRFGPETNVLWKTPVPTGHSSPIFQGDTLFLTAHEATNKNALITLAVDRGTGRITWQQTVHTETKSGFHDLNNPAASTPAADPKHVYAYFGTYGLLCYDHAGQRIWERRLDTPKSKYGMATSPVLYRDTLLLLQDGDGGKSRLLAVHKNTGETAWEQPRPLFKAGWSTPVLFAHDNTEDLVVLGAKRLTAYDPNTGEERWWAGGFPDETVGVPVVGEGLLIAGAAALGGRGDDQIDAAATWKMTTDEFDRNHDNQIQREEMTRGFGFIQRPELPKDNPGYAMPIRDMDAVLRMFDHDKNKIITEAEWTKSMAGFAAFSQPYLAAFRPGAKLDARPDHLAWETRRGIPETPSPLCVGGRLYLMRDGGLLTTLNAATGRELSRERIGAPGQYVASPVAAGNLLVVASVPGIVTVLNQGDSLDIAARNDLKEEIYATPALGEQTIYLRTAGHLYAFSEPTQATRAAEDLVIADFEGTDYGAWKITGEAFGTGPAPGSLPGQMAVDSFQGKGLVNSFHRGDTTTGTLTSPEFKIERRHIAFLIGGGRDFDRLSLNLVIDGRTVRSATGPNDRAGGSEALIPESWDVGEFLGRTAVLTIVDNATGGWGHINVDHIVQTDRKPPGSLLNPSREFRITQRYLLLPIRNGAHKRVVTTLVDGRVEVRNDVELAPGQPDWWAPMDVSAWIGRTVTLQVDKLPEDSTALASVTHSDTFPDADSLYRETARGQFHFSPRRGWNNDPNGLVYFNGEYHLFFQHNPYGWAWGNMHWGHAVSRDLVHWRELGDPLAPDAFGPMFSGSAVVDWNNTSGLGQPGHPALVLLYTAAGNPTVQCLASSTDGRRFTKLPANPIVREFTPGNRDPKVIWHEPSKHWVMTLYVETNKTHTIHFLTSTNLKDWTVTSQIPGFYECPDLFELPVDGDPSRRKWVLTAASSEYQVGTFDGKMFTPETPKLVGHRGRGFYAAQTFSDIPANDGRRIQIGWFQTETKGMPFNQSMTLPLELKLLGTPEGPRLTWTPVRELASLRGRKHSASATTLTPGAPNPLAEVQSELLEIRAEFEPDPAAQVAFTVRGTQIVYDARKQELTVNGDHHAPAPLRNGKQNLILYCDRTGLEIFASDGLSYVPMPRLAPAGDLSVQVSTREGSVRIHSLEVHELRPAWNRPE
jgi:sucrose-6-phosphate hydrolase SacC (GH32 family)/outer membrane protein assembly factor BamB